MADAGANTLYFVGAYAHTNPTAADEYGTVRLTFSHQRGGFEGKIRVIHALGYGSSAIQHFVAQSFYLRDNGFSQRETGMVISNSYFHKRLKSAVY